MTAQQKSQQNGPDFKTLGLKSPMEVIDILALLHIEGEPVVSDEQALLDPNLKAQAVMEFFFRKFKVKPTSLPYIASIIKKQLKQGKIAWGRS